MSAQHKRPLFAFVIVALIGATVLANAARSDALRGFLHERAASIVAGQAFDAAPAPEAAPAAIAPVAAPVTSTRPAGRAAHVRTRVAPAKAVKAHGTKDPSRRTHGQAHGHGKALGHQRQKAHGKPVTSAHEDHAKGKAKSHAKGHGQTKGHGKGHGQAAHGHAKHHGNPHRR